MYFSGQGSEVHWNLYIGINLFVKTIVNYCIFLIKYILENCTLSIKMLLCKLVQALMRCSGVNSSPTHLRTSAMSSAPVHTCCSCQ